MEDEEASLARARAVRLQPCAECGYVQDAMSPAAGGDTPDEAQPTPGHSLIICLACGALTIVDEAPSVGMFARPLSPEEHLQAMADPSVVNALAMRAIMVRRARAAGWRPEDRR